MTDREEKELRRQEAIARIPPRDTGENRMIRYGRSLSRSGRIAGLIAGATRCVERAMRSVRGPKPYVAFSGGKDSTCVAALVRRACPKAVLVWCDDELEYPETVELMRDYYRTCGPERFERLPGTGPHNDWFHPWRDKTYPWREPKGVGHLPSVHVWEADLGYNVVFLGTRSSENSRREKWLGKAGPIYRVKGGIVRCCPIHDWSDDDVWTLIAGWNLRYNAAYDTFDRLNLPGHLWRVGPLPLVPRRTLELGWPEMFARLETSYGPRWG